MYTLRSLASTTDTGWFHRTLMTVAATPALDFRGSPSCLICGCRADLDHIDSDNHKPASSPWRA